MIETGPNPNPDLFTTFEHLETTHRVEVRADNLHLIAQHFGWRVAYDFQEPRLIKANDPGITIQVGSWIDQRGARWNPEPLTQGWHPEGTYHADGSRA